MNDHDTISRLVELHDHIAVPAAPPELDVRRGERLLRRRRAAATVCGVAVVLLAVGVVQLFLPDGEGSVEPAPRPSLTETPTTGGEWTPERIRAEGSIGDPQGSIPPTESGLSTRLYELCDGPRCGWDSGFEDLHVAIEVTRGDRSAAFDLRWTGQPWLTAFDDDSVLVQDSDFGDQDHVRYRLLRADGTAEELRLVNVPARPVAGPGVVVIPDWSAWNGGMAGMEDAYLIDAGAATLQPLDAPDGVRYWAPNVDEFIWGVSDDCRVFWAAGGEFDHRRLDCSPALDFTGMPRAEEFPPGWLQPGRMVLWEQSDDPGKDDQFLHVSLDGGASWERIPVADGATAAVLRELG